MARHWLAISQIVVKELDIKKRNTQDYTKWDQQAKEISLKGSFCPEGDVANMNDFH